MQPRSAAARVRLLGIAALSILAFSQITRLFLFWLARHDLTASWAEVARALGAGLVYDIAVTAWLLLPLSLYLSAAGESLSRRGASRGLLRALIWCGAALGIFMALAEVLFFDEFTGRFNFVAVDYLIYPTEVTTNLWESYPLGWLLGGIAVAATAYVWAIRRTIAGAMATVPAVRWRAGWLAGHAAVLATTVVAVSPGLARVSDDRELNEIASNGWYTFAQALRGQDAPYDGWYATDDPAAETRRLGDLLAEPGLENAPLEPGSTLRHVNVTGPSRRLNVVVVLEESLGSQLVGTLHPRDTSLTPHFDSLATEGTLLTNVYSTGNRTIRALEATTSSLPPLPGISIVRRPASRGLFTLPQVLRDRGYATEFLYGGRALFDGMGAYMRANGMEHVVEQSDFPDSLFRTAWGVADEYIFDRALTQMDSLSAAQRPFYLLVLSVSNHKPYTYPPGRISADPAQHKRVNAVQYADWALGRFMRQAREHDWFDNTLFVLMGDHGARVYGASEIPLPSYEVPALLYAPGLIPAGQRLGTLASLLDIPPTILARMGLEYESRFFGRDILRLPPAEGRAFMTHNSALALMRGSEVAVLGLRGSASVFRYDSASARLHRIAEPGSREDKLVHDAIAVFHSADRLYRSGGYQALTVRTPARSGQPASP